MAQTNLQDFLLKLRQNFNYLKEQEAKYGSVAAPVGLWNQIKDYEQAIVKTEQAMEQNISPDELQVEFSGLNLQLNAVVFVPSEPPRKPFTGRNPYRGLEKFTEAEAEFFFGRSEAIQTLLGQVQRLVKTETSAQNPDLVAVLGASGSGKSSLVRAGLIPALRAGRVPGSESWPIKVMRPGPRPLEALAELFVGQIGRGLAAIRAELDGGEKALYYLLTESLVGQPEVSFFVLVIDQFEEMFTLTEQENERQAFLAQLLYASQVRRNRGFIILTMRADFYAKASTYKPLAEAITRCQMLVSPMTEKELREAILLPAEAVGLEIEKDLAQALVQDSLAAPGALPLLQHALLELFHRRDGNLLTMQAYREIGGIKGALAHRADSVMAGLTVEQQVLARNIFLRLTALGEGISDTRRRVNRVQLYPAGLDSVQVEVVLAALAGEEARLVVTDKETVEVTHEALIQQWGQLRNWLEENREVERIRQRLTEAASEWAVNERDASYLYTGARLAEAEEWAQAHGAEMTAAEQAFLTASIDNREREARERKKRIQRIIAGLAIGLVLIAIAAVFGFVGQYQAAQGQATAQAERDRANAESTKAIESANLAATNEAKAVENANLAATREAEAQANANLAATREAEANRQRRISLANQLAAQAQTEVEQWPQRSLLLAIEAITTTAIKGESPIIAAEQSLRDVQLKTGGLPLQGHNTSVIDVSFSPDNRWLATLDAQGKAILWDLTSPYNPIITFTQSISDVGFNSKSWLITQDAVNNFELRDLTNLAISPIMLIPAKANLAIKAISPNNRWLVTSDPDYNLHLWDTTKPTSAPLPVVTYQNEYFSTTFSPDNQWLISGDTYPQLWNLANPTSPPVSLAAGELDDLAISPDNHWLVSYGYSAGPSLWDLTKTTALPIILEGDDGYDGLVNDTAISPDSRWFVMARLNDVVRLWDLNHPTTSAITIAAHKETDIVTFSPDNHWLVTAGSDDDYGDYAVRLWNLNDLNAPPISLGGYQDDNITGVVISPDSRWLVITVAGSNSVRLWDLTVLQSPPLILAGHEAAISKVMEEVGTGPFLAGTISTVARLQEGIIIARFSSDSRWLLTVGKDNTPRLWDLNKLKLSTLYETLAIHDGLDVVTFGPDLRWLATSSGDSNAKVWDTTNLTTNLIATPTVLQGHSYVEDLVISPNNRYLIVTGGKANDQSVRNATLIWDLTNLQATPTKLEPDYESLFNVDMAISPDSRWIALGGGRGFEPMAPQTETQVYLWDLTHPTIPAVILKHDYAVGGVIFTSDSHELITADGATARLWDLTKSTPQEVARFSGHSDNITVLALSLDNKWLVTGSDDTTARFWDLTDPVKKPVILKGHSNPINVVAISPDQHWLATGGQDAIVQLWDLTNLAKPSFVLASHEDQILSMAFTPDSQQLFTGSSDTTIRQWNLNDPTQPPIIFTGHSGEVIAITVSPKGQWLYSGSTDGTVRRWRLRTDEMVKQACEIAGRNLSFEEWKQFLAGDEYRLTCSNLPIHPSFIQYGLDLARAGKFEAAVAHLQRVTKIDPKTELNPEEIIKPIAVEYYREEAQTLAKEGDLTGAIAKMREALKFNPDLAPETEARKFVADSLVEQGIRLLLKRDFKGTAAKFQEALTLYPELDLGEARRYAVHYVIALANLSIMDEVYSDDYFEEAVSIYKNVEILDPNFEAVEERKEEAALLVSSAEYSLENNYLLQARAMLDVALMLDPDLDFDPEEKIANYRRNNSN